MKKITLFLLLFALIINVPFYSSADTSYIEPSPISGEDQETAEMEDLSSLGPIESDDNAELYKDEVLIANAREALIDPTDVVTSDTIIDDGDAALNSTSADVEKVQTISLNYDVTSVQDDFKYMFGKSMVMTADQISQNNSFGLQGGCTDGIYYYFAIAIVTENSAHINTHILCATRNSDGSFSRVALSTGLISKLHHAGDMTYNKYTDQVIITSSESGYHHEIHTIPASKLKTGATISDFTTVPVSCMVTSIDFNEKKNQYVIGITNHLCYFAVLDHDFNLISTFGQLANYSFDEGWARQGIYCDENYIYSLNYYIGGDKLPELSFAEGKSKLRVFSWSGELIKTLYFPVTGVPSGDSCEIENMFVVNGEIFLNFFCRSKTNRASYYYDLSDIAFHIQYCPNENVGAYPNNSSNRKNFVIRGIATPLLVIQESNPGYYFTGWTAYRKEIDSWCCQSADKSTIKWIKTSELNNPENAGYTKYVYPEKHAVVQTGLAGEHLYMCAQWAPTNYFFVQYYSNGGSGTMTQSSMVYGNSTLLKSNTFTKTVNGESRTFQGWHAYWVERNMWRYENKTTGATDWYYENCQPPGYTKYVYANGQNVIQTAWKGGHIHLRAVWDEFNIFYNAYYAIIDQGNELEMDIGWYKSGNKNLLQNYTEGSFDPTSKRSFTQWEGWVLYRRDLNLWYFENASGSFRDWYDYETGTNLGYTRYVKPKATSMYLGGTARPGENLVLRAKWTGYD